MLALDLGFFHRKAHKPSLPEALVWSAVWVGLALFFNAGLYVWFGPQTALEFFTGYLIEKALSIDNLFVILVIVTSLAVPAELHHKILFWGILGALVMRGLFVGAGAALLQNFHWTIYAFGGEWAGRESSTVQAIAMFRPILTWRSSRMPMNRAFSCGCPPRYPKNHAKLLKMSRPAAKMTAPSRIVRRASMMLTSLSGRRDRWRSRRIRARCCRHGTCRRRLPFPCPCA